MLENIYTTKMSADKKSLQRRFSKIRSKNGKISKTMALFMTIFIVVTMIFATVVMAALDSEQSLENSDVKEPITLYSNGRLIILDNKPFVKDNIVYFPLRETFEKLGVFEIQGNEIVWDNWSINVKVTDDKTKEPVFYIIKIDSDIIDIKDVRDKRITGVSVQPAMNVKLQIPKQTPLLIGDKTYVPYTFIDYMLNRGLGIRNNQSVFDFIFTINGEVPSAFISQGFMLPCEGKVSNCFGERKHPITGEVIKHNGVDIAASEGTEVRASTYGIVTDCGFDAENGYYIVIEREHIKTVYCHLMQDMSVIKGDEVVVGQVIGKVGKTGMATGANLHFEVIINGEYFNPECVY